MFVWHANNLQAGEEQIAFQLGLGFPNLQAGGQVVAHASIARNVPPAELVDAGICVAAHLFGTLESNSQLPWIPGLGGEWFVALGSVDHGDVFGCVNELTIEAPAAQTLQIRVIGSTNLQMGTFADPCPTTTKHARGSWPYSDVSVASSAPFDASVPRDEQWHDVAEFDVDAPSSQERILFAKRPEDACGTPDGNRGLFGVNILYYVTATNPSPDQHSIQPTLRARNNAKVPRFAGAAIGVRKILLPVPYRVPEIKPGEENERSVDLQSAKLVPFEAGKSLSVGLTVAPGTNYEVSLTYRSVNATAP